MKTVFATFLGNGKLEARDVLDKALLADNYGVGGIVKLQVTNPRSHKQLNYFFGWLKEIFENLPEDCPERINDSEHLRSWMLYKSGNSKCWQFPRDGMDQKIIRMLKRMSHKHLFFEYTDRDVFVFEPESIAMATMDQPAFNAFFTEAKTLAQELIPDIDLKALDARVNEQYMAPN